MTHRYVCVCAVSTRHATAVVYVIRRVIIHNISMGVVLSFPSLYLFVFPCARVVTMLLMLCSVVVQFSYRRLLYLFIRIVAVLFREKCVISRREVIKQ